MTETEFRDLVEDRAAVLRWGCGGFHDRATLAVICDGRVLELKVEFDRETTDDIEA